MKYFSPLVMILFCLCGHSFSIEIEAKKNYKLLGFFPIRMRKSVPDSVHLNFETKRCGLMNYDNGILVMEAAKFAIQKVNQFLPFTLSLESLDTCESQDVAIKRLLPFIISSSKPSQPAKPLPFDSRCLLNISKTSRFQDDIIGVIGAGKSGVSLALQDLLKIFNIPQISYMSTSYALSNTKNHETFARTVPSDRSRLKLLINILKEFDWIHVNVVYDNFPYALDGRETFRDLYYKERLLNIFMDERYDENSVNDLPQKICKSVQNNSVSVVLTFLTRKWLFQFLTNLRTICDSNVMDRIVWLGTDTWLMTDMKTSFLHILKNAMVLAPQIVREPNFQTYLNQLKRSPEEVSWYKDYLKQLKCSPENREMCEENIFSYVDTSVYIHNAVNSIYAYAYAALNFTQSNGSHSEEYFMKVLRNLSFNDTVGEEFHFVKGVDGLNKFSLVTFNETTGERIILANIDGNKEVGLDPDVRASLSARFPPSICRKLCSPGQSQYFDASERCWECRQCSLNQIVNYINKSSPIKESVCQACPEGEKANSNRSGCIPRGHMNHSRPEALVVDSMSGVGLILVILMASLLVHYRDTPIVKASGRETCAFSFLGITLSFLSAITMNFPPSNILCILMYTLPGFCTTISYAAILARIMRISRIFNNTSKKDLSIRFTSPVAQFVFILIFTFLEVFALTVFCVISTPVARLDHNQDRMVCGEQDKEKRIFVLQLGLVIPSILLISSSVYAVKIRKVPYGFNETIRICFVNFVNITLLVLALISFLVLSTNEMEVDIVISYSLVTSGLSQLIGLYSHKAYILIFRKEKNTIEHVMCRRRTTIGESNCVNNKSNIVNGVRSESVDSALSRTFSLSDEVKDSRLHSISLPSYTMNGNSSSEKKGETNLTMLPEESSTNSHL